MNNVRPRYKILHNLPVYCLNFHHCLNYSNNGILVLLSCKVIQNIINLINGENEFYFFYLQVGWTTETKYYRTFGTTHYRCVLNYLKVCTLDIVNSIIFGQLDTQNWIFCGNDIVSISADIFFRHCCHIYNKCCVKVKTFQNSFELFLKWDHIKDKSPINMFIGNFLWIRLKKTKGKDKNLDEQKIHSTI